MSGRWVPHDTRDIVVDFMTAYAELTELPMTKLLTWAKIPRSSFSTWRQRYGKANEHNARSHATTGSTPKSAMRSSPTTIATRSKAIVGWPS